MIFPKLDSSCCQSLGTNLHLCLNELSSAVPFRGCSGGGLFGSSAGWAAKGKESSRAVALVQQTSEDGKS